MATWFISSLALIVSVLAFVSRWEGVRQTLSTWGLKLINPIYKRCTGRTLQPWHPLHVVWQELFVITKIGDGRVLESATEGIRWCVRNYGVNDRQVSGIELRFVRVEPNDLPKGTKMRVAKKFDPFVRVPALGATRWEQITRSSNQDLCIWKDLDVPNQFHLGSHLEVRAETSLGETIIGYYERYRPPISQEPEMLPRSMKPRVPWIIWFILVSALLLGAVLLGLDLADGIGIRQVGVNTEG